MICQIPAQALYTAPKPRKTLAMLAKLALTPLLIPQALLIRRKALTLPEPPGPRVGHAGSGPPLRLLILGDSSAAGVGASHQSRALSGQLVTLLSQSHTLHWRLAAQTGATSASTLARLDDMPPQKFDVAIVALGVNDVTRQVPLSRFRARRRAIHDQLRTKFGTGKIIASGLPPMGHFPLLPQPLRWALGRDAIRFDHALSDLCAHQTDTAHLPLDLPFDPRFVARDGFHPSEPAYTRWAEMLAAIL